VKLEKERIDFLKEFILTFSSRKSLFSSKKIERFIVFWVFLTLSVIYISINIHDMEAWDFVEVAGLFLVYGGANSLMGLREKKIDSQIEINQSEATSDEGDIKK